MLQRRQRGFTIIEAILVITIGTVLLATGTVLYNQYVESAGNSAAFDRVVALQSTVESLYGRAATSSYPALSAVAREWKAKRQSDYNRSPWGGPATGSIGNAARYALHDVPVLGYPLSNGGSGGGWIKAPDALLGDAGALYYWTTVEPGGYIKAKDAAGGGENYVGHQGYMVAVVPKTPGKVPPYYFIRGARPATDSVSGDYGVSGGIGGPTPPPDPW